MENKLTNKQVKALLDEYDRLDVNPSIDDERRMREIMALVSPQDARQAGVKVFSIERAEDDKSK